MAVNFDTLRETIFYGGPKKGTDSWGWYVTTNGESRSLVFFGSKKIMQRITKELGAKISELPAFKDASDDILEAAVIMLMAQECGNDDDYDFVADVLPRRFDDDSGARLAQLLDAPKSFREWIRGQDLQGR